tara:strand:- start:368 stop:664 length:297 start_codon:yes stop_codon:yes gene_type:complete
MSDIKMITLQNIILDSLMVEEIEENNLNTDSAKVSYILTRFTQEMRQNVSKENVAGWLQGLALDTPYMYHDIEALGLDNATYWEDLANTIITLHWSNM